MILDGIPSPCPLCGTRLGYHDWDCDRGPGGLARSMRAAGASAVSEQPAEAEWRWSICTDCGMWDLVAGLRDPLCIYCGELRALPPRRDRRRPLRLAALLCALAAVFVGADAHLLAWVAPAVMLGAALALVCSWGRP